MSCPAESTSPLRVLLRLRPASEAATRCLNACSPTTLRLSNRDGTQQHFQYDSVIDEASSQEHVFELIKPVVHAVMQGHNGTVLAYGQTGSGKTHTLIGDVTSGSKERGLVSRAVAELARCMSTQSKTSIFQVTLSVVEIYCERIRCLLSSEDAGRNNLAVVNDAARGILVSGATEVPVDSEEELLSMMHIGINNRTVCQTAMNAASSRSHCIVYLIIRRMMDDGTSLHGKLTLVDLAGSERQNRISADGLTFEEGKLINKSLSALGNVVNCLADDSSPHVPYRDSKLTRVLQDSLGGSAKTMLIVCCSPSACDAAETLSSLRFGARARGVVNAAQAPTKTTLGPDELQQQLLAARKELAQLRAQVAEAMTSTCLEGGSKVDHSNTEGAHAEHASMQTLNATHSAGWASLKVRKRRLLVLVWVLQALSCATFVLHKHCGLGIGALRNSAVPIGMMLP